MKKITNEMMEKYRFYLTNEEKSPATVEKYIRDVTTFKRWLEDKSVEKMIVMDYKQQLIENYAPASANSMLSSLNHFFGYAGWFDCKVKTFKIQKQIFVNQNRELSKSEYEKILFEAKKNKKLYLLVQTLCCTGIRVSELRYITVSAARKGESIINCKGKMRVVILPKELCRMLISYCKEQNISFGSIFVTKNGNPIDRSNIWKMMKKLCSGAGISKEKVFPHNLRHLFARTFYSQEKDVVRLADILGHSSINTTRIYTMETGEQHRSQLQRLGLLRC